MFRMLHCLAIAAWCLASAAAEEPAAPPADKPAKQPVPYAAAGAQAPAPIPGEHKPAVQPAVVQLDANHFKVGEVEFNSETRVISFPAVVNMADGLLEYVIVHENGKVHESLLRTKISPLHLNVALKLLRYETSRELFPLCNDDGIPTGKFPQVDEKTKQAARVAIRMRWKAGETEHSTTINACITDTAKHQPMPPGPWLYTGSVVFDGRFLAEETGDVAGILTNEASVFNYPGNDRENDEVWVVLTKVVPPEGTPVTVEIGPWQAPDKAPPRRQASKP